MPLIVAIKPQIAINASTLFRVLMGRVQIYLFLDQKLVSCNDV